MYIAMIASECAPVSKVGGLADVVDGLSRELMTKGHKVEIILPYYDCMNHSLVEDLQGNPMALSVQYGGKRIFCTAHTGRVHDNVCYFIRSHSEERYFDRGLFYGAEDDEERFTFFCLAALEFLREAGKHPDVIHCHDWQTALIPALLKLKQKSSTKTCYTIHNIRHQGKITDNALKKAGLDPSSLTGKDSMLDDSNHGYINLMKGGIISSDAVTTVSPRYSIETRTSRQGEGLEGILSQHADKYEGIINGVDYDTWNPATDSNIPFNYSVDTIEDKYKNKEFLRSKLSLRNAFKPIISVVGRLDMQKGVHLIRDAILNALNDGIQFVLLGSSPDNEIAEYFYHLKHYLKNNPDCHINLSHDEDLAHLIYAGSDLILIPSLFEPCGLTQMLAMRYGTVPIVRKTGGLGDTVFDINDPDRARTQRNGFVFTDFTYDAIELALKRAATTWNEKPYTFREIMLAGMTTDYSWTIPAERYLSVYSKISGKQ
ncbi:MAG: glycogen synthase [Nitrospirae bacterium]|nr:glycogen synthase [Nitrospirota bacterium]MBF0592375.1 glycogen synthase [Nitrospirota bacterium]